MISTQNTNENISFIGFYVILSIIFLIALGPYLQRQEIVTSLLIPTLAVIAFSQDIRTFHKNNREFLFLVLIFIFSIPSIFYYINYDALTIGFRGLFGAVLAAYIPVALNKNKDFSPYFHIGYVTAVLILIFIMFIKGNFNFVNFATKVDYRDRFMLNANQYSYFSYFANFSLFYLYQKNKSWFLLALLILLPILFIIVSFATQSRSGMLMVIIVNLCYWIFIHKNIQNNQLSSLLRKVLILLAFILISIQFVKIYENSRIKNRLEISNSKVDSRELLIVESMKVFENNPFLGVGLNQLPFYNRVGQFSHNSYVEILAEQGILGGIFLFMLFIIPLIKCSRNLRLNPLDPIMRINLLFFVTFYLYNNAYPFYKFTFSMMYFFLIISVQNRTKAIDV